MHPRTQATRMLLAADAVRGDEEIARTVAVSGSTVYRTKRRFVEGNLERALLEDRALDERKLTGEENSARGDGLHEPSRSLARWTPIPFSPCDRHAHRAREPVGRDGAPAAGRKRPQALAQGYVVHSPGRRRICRRQWKLVSTCMPIARSQAAGGLLRRKPSPAHRRGAPPIPAEPVQLEHYDYEYRRNGTVNIFVCIDVHRPWRKVKVTKQAHRQKTTPNACVNLPISIIPMPSISGL